LSFIFFGAKIGIVFNDTNLRDFFIISKLNQQEPKAPADGL
jgi:hypothetical protein